MGGCTHHRETAHASRRGRSARTQRTAQLRPIRMRCPVGRMTRRRMPRGAVPHALKCARGSARRGNGGDFHPWLICTPQTTVKCLSSENSFVIRGPSPLTVQIRCWHLSRRLSFALITSKNAGIPREWVVVRHCQYIYGATELVPALVHLLAHVRRLPPPRNVFSVGISYFYCVCEG